MTQDKDVAELGRKHDLLIFDDILPFDFSPFRTAEYSHYLKFFDSALFSLEGWHHWLANGSFEDYLARLPFDDGLKRRIGRIEDSGAVAGRLAYVTFLGNAIRLIDLFELRRLPFVLQLYPGGAFELYTEETDRRLNRVLRSPLCRRVIVTQKVSRDYLVERIGIEESKIRLIYGGVYDSNVDFDFLRDKLRYPDQKATIDICFVAHRYSDNFALKGYDRFVALGRELSRRHEHLRFHVVGEYSPDDLDLSEARDRFVFHGKQDPTFFAGFYPRMDAIVALNKPFSGAAGVFDGFPTGACMEAGFRGVLNCINDPLGNNVAFKDGQDIVLLDEDMERTIERIDAVVTDPARMYEVAYAGWRAFRDVFSVDRQLWGRTQVIVEELLRDDALFSSPLVSWGAVRAFMGGANQSQELLTQLGHADAAIKLKDGYIADLHKSVQDCVDQLSVAADAIAVKDGYIRELQVTVEEQVRLVQEQIGKTAEVWEQLLAANRYAALKEEQIKDILQARS